MCQQFRDLLILLDGMFSDLRTPYGSVTNKMCETYRTKKVPAAQKLMRQLTMSHTPKWHVLLSHAANQLSTTGGFADMGEDFVELGHQTGDREQRRVAGLKNFKLEVLSKSRSEVVRNCKSVQEARETVQLSSRRKILNRTRPTAEATH